MKLKVLGCSGGIGGRLRSTAFLVDDDILIDGGTGLVNLGLTALTRINHVFVTHAHLDHIACLPLLVDTVAHRRHRPVTIHAPADVIVALREHIFNWKIWPDFTRIPSAEQPYLHFEAMLPGEPYICGARRVLTIPALHTVPAVGYHLDSGEGSLIFSGDTSSNAALWDYANGIGNLRHVIIETAFSNQDVNIAVASKHLWPEMLAAELTKLERPAQIHITHLKPGDAQKIMRQIQNSTHVHQPQMLRHGQVIEF